MNVKTEGTKLIIERTFPVTQDRLFKAFTTSSELEAWWGPKGWKTTNKRFEFEAGGYWHYCMKCEDKNQGDFYGMESWGLAKFKEIHVPERFLYEDMFSDEEGNVSPDLPGMDIEVAFIPVEGGTQMVTTTFFDSVESLEKVSEMGMVEGTASQLDRLEEYLNERFSI